MPEFNAEVEMWATPPNKPRRQVISEGMIQERAYRLCDLGSAACGLRPDIDVSVAIRHDGSGIGDVTQQCPNKTCPVTDQALQAGLDRLRSSAVQGL